MGILLSRLGAPVPETLGELADGSCIYELFLFPRDVGKHEKVPGQGKILFTRQGKEMGNIQSGTSSDLETLLAVDDVIQQMKDSHWLRIMTDIVESVKSLHSVDMTHSDIKVTSILIS